MSGAQADRQTWEDWIAPHDRPDEGDLLTRKEVLTKARALHVLRPNGREVDERAMRYWEKLGIIPRGSTATSGYQYKLYPWWVVDMLHQVCRYRAAGVDLDQLPDLMHEEALRLSRDPWPRRKRRATPVHGNPDFWASILDPEERERLREPTQPPFRPPPDVVYDRAVGRLVALLNTLAPSNGFAQPSWVIPTRVRVDFIGEQGQSVRAYDVALDDPGAVDDFIEQDKRAGQAETIEHLRRGFSQ